MTPTSCPGDVFIAILTMLGRSLHVGFQENVAVNIYNFDVLINYKCDIIKVTNYISVCT